MRAVVIGSVVLGLALAAQPAAAQPPRNAPPPQAPMKNQPANGAAAQQTLNAVRDAFGFVPEFFRALPPEMMASFWEDLKFQGARTALDPKTKELIGLAVAAQIPCEYCTYYHRNAARAHGATEAELKEAVSMGGITRMGSTLLNGLDIDMQQFRRDVDRIVRGMKQSAQNTRARPRTP